MRTPIPSTLLPTLLLLLLLPPAWTGSSSQLESVVGWSRRQVVNRSLKGFWKLSSDSNFRINSKLTMINEQSDRKKRITSMLNFLVPPDGLVEAEAFFEAPQEGR